MEGRQRDGFGAFGAAKSQGTQKRPIALGNAPGEKSFITRGSPRGEKSELEPAKPKAQGEGSTPGKSPVTAY